MPILPRRSPWALLALILAGCADPISVTQTVGAEGALLELGEFYLAVPPGALSEDTELGFELVTDLAADGLPLSSLSGDDLGLNVRLIPHGTTFATPLVIAFPTLGLVDDDTIPSRLADDDADAWTGIGPLLQMGDSALLSIDGFSYYSLGQASAACPCWTAADVAAFHRQGAAWLGADVTRRAWTHDVASEPFSYSDGGTIVDVLTKRGGATYAGAATMQLAEASIDGNGAGRCEVATLGAEVASTWFPNATPGVQELVSADEYNGCAAALKAHAPAPGALSQTLRLLAVGVSKLSVIKVVKTLTGLGLKESKELVESAPADVRTGIARAEADAGHAFLLASGAEAEIVVVGDPAIGRGLQVGFVATGLTAAEVVVVRLAGGRDVTVASDGLPAWAVEGMATGTTFSVEVRTAPTGVACTASPTTGTLSAHTLVTVACAPIPELCNALDDDGDGETDEGFDTDGDDVTTCGPDGVASNTDDDCDDADADAFPGNPEVCDGVDNDCSGAFDVGETNDGDADGVPDLCDLNPGTTCEAFTTVDIEALLLFAGAICLQDATGASIPGPVLDGTQIFTGAFVDHGFGAWEVAAAVLDPFGAYFTPQGCYQDAGTGPCTDLGRPLLPAGSEATQEQYNACHDVASYSCR